MKGIILAGGKGTRLLPATKVLNKHMIPILNKPMITYPLDTLKHLGVTDIMVITGGDHVGGIAEFLGDGSDFDVNLTYRVQKGAGGIAQALALAEDFCKLDPEVAVILGDNVFDNSMLSSMKAHRQWNARIFIKNVKDPERFGVFVEDNTQPGILGYIEEKPKEPKSTMAVTGLYVYPTDSLFSIIKKLKPSARGELEITDVNNEYLSTGGCEVGMVFGFWSDAGTPESLLAVNNWAYGK
jgi:glucose-1-phosphate thymidylyltransferase